MITGLHTLIYSTDAEADRAFLRDILAFGHVDAGDGWLIFAMPPAELGVHPADAGGQHELSLMCDDINVTMAELGDKGVEFTRPVQDAGYGIVTAMRLPSGAELTLYEPRHATVLAGFRGSTLE